MTEALKRLDLRSEQTPEHPSVAIIRGEALNPFEMQAFGPLTSTHRILAIGRRRPHYEVETLPMEVRLLPSLGSSRMARSIHRRMSPSMRRRINLDGLRGLENAVTGLDILHAAETVLPVSEQAALLAPRLRQRLVLTCWETIPFRYDDDPTLAWRKQVVRSAQPVYVAVTQRARDALVAEGVEPREVAVVPAAVDCTRFRPRPTSAPLRAELGLPDGVPLVLFVGRLIQEKGVVELVQAFARADRGGTAHLVMVGNGDQAERVNIAARANGVASRVSVRPGLSYSRLPELYATVDVVVAPSLTTPYWEEQFGMVLVEALASGKPLITTASGAIPEVVGDAAVVIEPYRTELLAEAIRQVLDDLDLRRSLAAAARERALRLYDVPVVSEQWRTVYQMATTV